MKYYVYIIILFTFFNYVYSITPQEAIDKLKDGNTRFITGTQLHPNLTPDRLKSTAENGQKPFATILACSDSRSPVELIFDAGIGDLFVIKVAGNVADVDEIATIEYGTHHLNTPVLVVLGHTKCGAVTAVVKNAELHGHLPALVDNVKPAFDAVKQQVKSNVEDELVIATIKANVYQSIGDILSKSKIVADLVKEGKLTVIGAIYDIETGNIDWLGSHPDEKKLAESAKETHLGEHKDGFFSSSNFIFMAIFIALVSAIAAIIIVLLTKKKSKD